jgi:hypothetical protein
MSTISSGSQRQCPLEFARILLFFVESRSEHSNNAVLQSFEKRCNYSEWMAITMRLSDFCEGASSASSQLTRVLVRKQSAVEKATYQHFPRTAICEGDVWILSLSVAISQIKIGNEAIVIFLFAATCIVLAHNFRSQLLSLLFNDVPILMRPRLCVKILQDLSK